MKLLCQALLILFASTFVSSAYADVLVCCGNKPVKWTTSGSDVTIKLITSMQNTIGDQPFRDAAARWSNLAGSAFDFTVSNDNDNTITSNGDGNEVGFFTELPGDHSSAAAITVSRYTLCETCDSWTCGGSECQTGHLVETDIYFLANGYDYGDPGSWTSDSGAQYNASNYRMIAAHELGHAAGLLENTSTGLSRMESHIPPGGWFSYAVPGASRVTPLAPDVFEMAGLYPDSNAGSTDLYAVNMQHRVTSSPNDNVNSIPLSWNGSDPLGFPRNRTWRGTDWRTAKVGDVVDVRVCFGNSGPPWSPTTTARFKFSTNTSPNDSTDVLTPDGWYYPGVGANTTWCDTLGITVPNVSPGSYFVIFGINGSPSGASNNWQVINRKVTVIN